MKKLILLIAFLLLALGFVSVGSLQARVGGDAENPCSDLSSGLSQGLDCLDQSVGADTNSGLLEKTDAITVLEKIINWLLGIVAALGLLALIVGGVLYIISFGDEKKTSTAKSIIFWAIIGIVVVGISFSIISILETFITKSSS